MTANTLIRSRFGAALLSAWLLLLPFVVSAQDQVSRLVEAEGMAPIINNDVRAARDMAIFEAKRAAVEPLGVRVDSETLYSMGLQVADWFRVKVGGYVKDYEVLSEGRRGDGYQVRIRAWVKAGDEEKKATRELLSQGKMLVIADGDGSQGIEGVLTEKLNEAGYRYHDSGFIRNNVRPATWERLVNRRIMDLDNDAFRFMADLVVHVQSSVKSTNPSSELGGTWFSGEGRIRLFQISGERQGEAIIDRPQRSTRLFGRGTGEMALMDVLATAHPNGFMRQIADPVVSSFVATLTQREDLKTGDRAIAVRITGVPSEAEFEEFLLVLRHQRGVDGRAEVVKKDGRAYTLSVKSPLKTTYLAYLLSVYPKYRIMAHDWSRVELAYRDR